MVALDPKLVTQELNDELIEYIRNKIVEHINPLKLVLYGSFAKGESRAGSDLDLFLLYDGPDRNISIRQKIDELFWGREFALDVLVRKPVDILLNIEANNNFYIEELMGKGKVLYERR